MMGKKKHSPPTRAAKPFIRGKMIDRTMPGAAAKFFGLTLLMVFVYLMSMMLASLESQLLNIVISAAILLTTWLIFGQMGQSSGADAVSQGEILYARREKGRPVETWESELCYHPLKGLLTALIGSIPLVAVCAVLACIAQRQMTSIGILPEWVSGFEGRQEIAQGLSYYHQEVQLTLETALRPIVRVVVMPWQNIFGTENRDAMLLLERLSPVLTLLPALSYGVGYAMGTREHAAKHANVALGKKNLQKKQYRERMARQKAAQRSSDTLN